MIRQSARTKKARFSDMYCEIYARSGSSNFGSAPDSGVVSSPSRISSFGAAGKSVCVMAGSVASCSALVAFATCLAMGSTAGSLADLSPDWACEVAGVTCSTGGRERAEPIYSLAFAR